ncbi:pseudouridine synthase [Luteolibacter pohnpeiensis]|uniref:tRNA uridine(34) hydroxylase n=1 Tax=Luteolibacter pohnpeiensis TaxID=454153 RepID=A0A934VVB4_9BACT|nr:pseudouridine synthase [Luteolibacter pohnpeiensis]MBK1881359.1 pseudouridine synthase [Luteolibacter pohnpeiensis]
MSTVTNISAYLFAELSDLKQLREELIAFCKVRNLKGTILLSTEGINMFVAGAAESIHELVERVHQVPGLEKLTPKISLSDHQPFNRMLVRIKKEIISFGVDGVRPAIRTSPKLASKELKQWLDEGRPITLLDTRNDYEVKLGTFKGAMIPHINSFREFPDAVRKLPDELKQQPVVMFCTGGIRCEKAGPFMEMEGFEQIYQLDGGILKYFEECGGDHYEGECFVFDQRVGVDPALRETETAVCYACQAPLDRADQEDPRYVVGISCPHCFKSEPEKMEERIAEREQAIQEICHPLPGSVPMENRRPVNIPAEHDRKELLEALTAIFPQVPPSEWERRCEAGRFVSYGGAVRNKDHVVRAGERILQIFPPAKEPDVATDIRILHEDEALLVIQKPAPLPMHPSGRFHRNTLQYILNQVYAPKYPRPVHRLDANTSGLVVFARTRHFCRLLQRQFLEGSVEKYYLVTAIGSPENDQFVCNEPISSAPGQMGSREIEEDGLPAKTEFTVLDRQEDGTCLLLAKLDTGRTNQIRVHLWSLGMPVKGDPTYLPDRKMGDTQTLDCDLPPLELHSWCMALTHPRTGERLVFATAAPAWVNALKLPEKIGDTVVGAAVG